MGKNVTRIQIKWTKGLLKTHNVHESIFAQLRCAHYETNNSEEETR